jgi:multidrug efflux pump subunit AcrA (membrane-fusion protein)
VQQLTRDLQRAGADRDHAQATVTDLQARVQAAGAALADSGEQLRAAQLRKQMERTINEQVTAQLATVMGEVRTALAAASEQSQRVAVCWPTAKTTIHHRSRQHCRQRQPPYGEVKLTMTKRLKLRVREAAACRPRRWLQLMWSRMICSATRRPLRMNPGSCWYNVIASVAAVTESAWRPARLNAQARVASWSAR